MFISSKFIWFLHYLLIHFAFELTVINFMFYNKCHVSLCSFLYFISCFFIGNYFLITFITFFISSCLAKYNTLLSYGIIYSKIQQILFFAIPSFR